jgi:hypothetical protein
MKEKLFSLVGTACGFLLIACAILVHFRHPNPEAKHVQVYFPANAELINAGYFGAENSRDIPVTVKRFEEYAAANKTFHPVVEYNTDWYSRSLYVDYLLNRGDGMFYHARLTIAPPFEGATDAAFYSLQWKWEAAGVWTATLTWNDSPTLCLAIAGFLFIYLWSKPILKILPRPRPA